MDNTAYKSEKVLPLFPEEPVIKMVTKSKGKARGTCRAIHAEKPTSHAADAFVSREDINNIVLTTLIKGDICKACMFICGINTGYRAGDLISLTVEDVTDDKGNIVDALCLCEDKTNKSRTVYLNKAFKTAAKLIIDKKHLTGSNYLFRGDGNRKSYIDGFKLDSDGNVIDVITTGNRYAEDGSEREVAPILVGSITRWLKGLSAITGIEGHYSSHAMRKTFVEHISRDWNDNRNAIAASAAVAHSSPEITIKYYMGIDQSKLHKKWLELNLGLEALELYMEG